MIVDDYKWDIDKPGFGLLKTAHTIQYLWKSFQFIKTFYIFYKGFKKVRN